MRLVKWLGIGRSKYYDWQNRYGKVNEHNSWIPRDSWLEPWEKQAIVEYYKDHSRDGYRRLTYMMIDNDIVAVSPSSVYRVLKYFDLLRRWNRKSSKKGTGFKQPTVAHMHWHTDISYINISGTFYYLCSVLDGYSRYIVHWEIRISMKERDVETVLQRAREKHPDTHPRIISDNGPQYIAKDFKEFIRISGMTHVRTSPFYPQSNGKQERWHKSLKNECIRPQTPLSLSDARRVVGNYVEHYNNIRLHSAIGYIAPRDKLEGRAEEIWAEREAKLAQAREERRRSRTVRPKQELIDRALKTKKQIDKERRSDIMIEAGETEAGSAGEHPARDSQSGVSRKTQEGMAPLSCSPALNKQSKKPFGDPHNALENSDLPQASHHLILKSDLSILR